MVYILRFFFSLQNAVCFIILTYLVHVLFTFYVQGVLKFKKNNSGAKRLIPSSPFLVPWSRKSRVIPLPPYGPYGWYRASVPVQYSYTSTPPIGLTACTEPQCLYRTAIPLLPLWASRPVQSHSACTVQLYLYSP